MRPLRRLFLFSTFLEGYKMLVSIYITLSVFAVLFLILGIGYGSMTYLGIAAMLSAILGFMSWNLTVITDSGDVVKLAGGEWVLSFVWGAIMVIAIIHIMFDLSMWRWGKNE